MAEIFAPGQYLTWGYQDLGCRAACAANFIAPWGNLYSDRERHFTLMGEVLRR